MPTMIMQLRSTSIKSDYGTLILQLTAILVLLPLVAGALAMHVQWPTAVDYDPAITYGP
jgi:hypothetical protein